MLAVVFGFLFAALAAFVFMMPSLAARIDAAATRSLVFFVTPRWSRVFTLIAFFAGPIGTTLIALAVAYFLADSQLITSFAIGIIGSAVMVQIIKLATARSRPREYHSPLPFTEYSFPSGHATSAVTLYGFLGIAAFLATGSPWPIIIAVIIIAAVGLSRLALSAHYLLDVIGGYLLGAFWLSLVLIS